jgi:small subunit ribosomal protein S10
MAAKHIRIRMKSYDHKILDDSVEEIVEVAERTGAEVAGPVPLPTKRRVYTVLRSPHVDKKSREQFEIRIHNRLIDLNKPSHQTMEALTKMDLPARVEVEIKY